MFEHGRRSSAPPPVHGCAGFCEDPFSPIAMDVENLKNIGPKSAAWLRDMGIHTRDDLQEMGVVMAWKILKHRRPEQVNLLLLYALEGTLSDRHWNALDPKRKAALKRAVSGRLEVAAGEVHGGDEME